MSIMQRIAVTGSNGVVGTRLCQDLARDFQVVSVDRTNAEFNLDVCDLLALKRAFTGCETVVHLAAAALTTAPWEAVRTSNIEGTYNVFEAARAVGCRRVIFASSHHVVGMYLPERAARGKEGAQELPPLGAADPPRPDSLYAVSKVFGEALGRFYSDSFGMQVACIRIGSMNAADSPRPPQSLLPWRRDGQAANRVGPKWFSHRDFARLVRAILARDIRFSIVYGVGDNRNRFLDLTPGRELYDYFPLDGDR
jgi:nucleoside-diphosphate-sugar epimerase